MQKTNFTFKARKQLFILLGLCLVAITGSAQLGWVQVPSPDTSSTRNMLRGITGTSSTDVWVAGSFQEVNPTPPNYVQKVLLMHWNGNCWHYFPSTSQSTTLDELWDIKAI